MPTRSISLRHAVLAAALTSALVGAACSVDYRPGTVRTDTAQGDAATAAPSAAPAAATLTPPPVALTPQAPSDSAATPPLDTLGGLGTAPPPPGTRTFPRTAADSSPPVDASDVAALRARGFAVPVTGVLAADLRESFTEARGGGSRSHEALDIMAPRGTPVVAADDGRVVKLFTSKAGGLTVYVATPDGRYLLYYAHLDRYRDGLAEGQSVRRGDPLGFVGSTGDASPDAPHLHFAIARVANPAWWWTGTAIDPFLVLKP